jgi:hypothetical protein
MHFPFISGKCQIADHKGSSSIHSFLDGFYYRNKYSGTQWNPIWESSSPRMLKLLRMMQYLLCVYV